MDNNEVTIFGETNFRNERRRFGIKRDDRRRHMYVIGKTGMGKSVLLENMLYSDIIAGRGVCYVDPHGDTVEKIIDCIPSNRINDVVYFNPADIDHPIAFNILEKVEPKYRHLIASGLVGVFKKIWAESWGPRLEYLLRNAILALLDYPDSTLLGVNRMLVDNDYRKKVVAKIQDPVVKAFWLDEFTKYNQVFLVEAIAPIQNKVGQFLSTSLIRNILGQVKSTIDIREIMDQQKILLVNLSKGRIGEDASGLLGNMMVTKMQLAAMSRVDIPEDERNDFYLYVDEFQNFATDSFANILSEARKYHLNLTIAHQYIEQLGEVVQPAVFGNVGTIICFRVGAADAEFLVREFTPKFTEEDLVNLPKYNVYLKLMIDGVSSDAFSAYTLPPISRKAGSAETIIKVCRERYSSSRESVEEKIARWSGIETEAMVEKLERDIEKKKAGAVLEHKRIDFLASLRGDYLREGEDELAPLKTEIGAAQGKSAERVSVLSSSKREATAEGEEKKEEYIEIVKCNGCGQKTKINFKPDPTRPVYCKECLKEFRRKQALEENAKKNSEGSGARRPMLPRRDDRARSPNRYSTAAPARDVSLSSLKPKS